MTRDEATQIAKFINSTWQLRWSRQTGDVWTQNLERHPHAYVLAYVEQRALHSEKPPTIAEISAHVRLQRRLNGEGEFARKTIGWQDAVDESTFTRAINEARRLLGGAHRQDIAS